MQQITLLVIYSQKKEVELGKGGYQRKPKETRISQIANKVSSDYYIPGAMITCYRDAQKKVSFSNGVGQFELDEDLYWMDDQTNAGLPKGLQ